MEWQQEIWANEPKEEEAVDKHTAKMDVGANRRRFACVELSDSYLYRRAFSELTLLDTLPQLLGGVSRCIVLQVGM